MKFQSATIRASLRFLMCCVFGSGAMWATTMAYGEDKPLPADVQTKVEKYKKKLTEWAGHPAIIAAVKESNKKAGATTMTNVAWDALGEKDPLVTAYQTNPAGKIISQWEGKDLVKLFVRDEKANLVAAGSGAKPLLYNNGNRPPFINGMKGSTWAASEAKPDPSTQRLAVQVSAPVKDGAKVIGVIHTAVNLE